MDGKPTSRSRAALAHAHGVSRREWMAFALGLGLALRAPAQPAARPRVGFINVGPERANVANVAAFRAGLADHGYHEGRTIDITWRWAGNDAARLPALVAELLAQKPHLLVATGGAVTARAVKQATTRVPAVFISGDPVAEGIVSNLARPGGNLTGIALLAPDLEAKRLELLTQLVPKARRIAVVRNPVQPTNEQIYRGVAEIAGRLGLELATYEARDRDELSGALAAIARARPDALYVIADPVIGFERARMVAFVKEQRLPSIFFWREFVKEGALASYGASLTQVYRRTGTYIDKILKGAAPGDLPVEQPTTFELVINLGAARALGLSVPPSLLARADEVID